MDANKKLGVALVGLGSYSEGELGPALNLWGEIEKLTANIHHIATVET
jgi:hypothetical protein